MVHIYVAKWRREDEPKRRQREGNGEDREQCCKPGCPSRVYVTEESHCGIVPMNHSNKDGTLVGGEWGGKAADQGEHSCI